ncbi:MULTISPECIES: hypothetical protein [Gracilibacillus]|uniref:hypothetical protein n=1 Tax=Gracilibacillus TaxID=74385 RepID=UPI0008258063|nr:MULTISPECIES: hypothetical protein [Gracilibacillus]
MSIKVKRNTGMLGGAMKVSLSVDGQQTSKLSNNEECIIDSTKDSTKIQAKQSFFGSPEKEVKDPVRIEIKINTMAVLLFIISLAFIFIGGMINHVIVIGIGLVSVIATMIYGVKNWFALEIMEE